MTTMDRFERDITDWLHEEAAHRPADHLGAVLERTATTRQRPAWSSLERWLPVDTTMSRFRFDVPIQLRILAIAALLAALAVGALLVSGTHSTKPLPFGPARNGAFVATSEGDIYRLDPASGARTALITGDGFDFGTVWSHDGSEFAFLRSAERPAPTGPRPIALVVANADGTNVRQVLQPTGDLTAVSWSPDNSKLLVQVVAASGAISTKVIDVATGKSTGFPVGRNVESPTWLAPDGAEVLFRATGPTPAIRAIDPNGTDLRTLSTHAPANESDFSAPMGAPDGKSVAYLHWDAATQRQSIVILDLASRTERTLPAPDQINVLGASYGPDGKSIVYTGLDTSTQLLWIYVAPVDGSSTGTRLGQPAPANSALEGSFTPDGKAIVVRSGTDDAATNTLYPIDGSQSTQLDSGSYDFIDVQRLAP